ncbi:MAG: spore germination protein GerW family protein [Actinomycetota bacterium]
MSANVNEILARAREVITVQQVFGEPIQQNGVIVVPVAAVRGGGGGGGGPDPETKIEGGGGGFGLIARPVGAYVIRGDQVEWKPAVDVTRIVTAGAALAGLALLTLRKAIKKRR